MSERSNMILVSLTMPGLYNSVYNPCPIQYIGQATAVFDKYPIKGREGLRASSPVLAVAAVAVALIAQARRFLEDMADGYCSFHSDYA